MAGLWLWALSVLLGMSVSAQKMDITEIHFARYLSRAENTALISVHYGDHETQKLVESWPWGSHYVEGLSSPFTDGVASLNDVIARLRLGDVQTVSCEKLYGVGTLFTSVRDNYLRCTVEFERFGLELIAIEQIFGVLEYTVRTGPLPAALYFRGF